MRTIITVVEYPSMPGRYLVKSDANSRDRYNKPRDVWGAGAAAAAAMEYAQISGSIGYQIFAPENVMDMIPVDMRGRP
ncbi:MAG: hypothetical protein WCZ87_02370 [Thiohalobacteraceae bacterium]